MTAPLIVLEGIDGSGTTTQARLLCERLEREGIAAHLTREPSDGPVGRLLREILQGKHSPTDATTHSLLFAADRADHIQREVTPALEAGKVVVSDRWYHSSLAYQGDGEERAWIAELNRRARVPDLSILVEVSADEAAKRRSDAGREHELFDALDKQRRVAAGYREVMESLAGREPVEIIDGARSVEEVADHIYRLVSERCDLPGGS